MRGPAMLAHLPRVPGPAWANKERATLDSHLPMMWKEVVLLRRARMSTTATVGTRERPRVVDGAARDALRDTPGRSDRRLNGPVPTPALNEPETGIGHGGADDDFRHSPGSTLSEGPAERP